MTKEQVEHMIEVGRKVHHSLGDGGELPKALDFASTYGDSSRRGTVFLPNHQVNRPLEDHLAFSEVLRRLGYTVDTLTESELPLTQGATIHFTETDFEERLAAAAIIFIPNPICMAYFPQSLIRQIRLGTPTLIESFRPSDFPHLDADWDLLTGKLGVWFVPGAQVIDPTDYFGHDSSPVFRKDNESLRHGQLFDAVDSLSFATAAPISARGSLAQRIVIGSPATKVRHSGDEWASWGGAEVCCAAVSTHTVIPETSVRVLTISGKVFVDSYDTAYGPIPGITNNLGFALNTVDFLLSS